ncbi:MAG: class I SAM-dependent methyltransferase [Eubacteriales bacterium]|nr:class I SAM-dependent methyltransferase [Eubacteriales bacterium]
MSVTVRLMKTRIEQSVFGLIDRLNLLNGGKNIFYGQPSEDSSLLGDYVASFLVSHSPELIEYLSDAESQELEGFIRQVIDYSTKGVFDTLLHLNQYVDVDDQFLCALNDLYEDFVRAVFGKLQTDRTIDPHWLTVRVMEHQLRLRSLLGSVDELRIFPDELEYLEPVPCSDYSAELQLHILGIRPDELLEPVLDLGCGEQANLVIYLRQLGIKAYGLDRINRNQLHVCQASWFKVKLHANQWGTVISHLSFTNHFRRHHLKVNGQHAAYARKYMEVLGSLKPKGSFFYTPDLPLVEQFLSPDLYSVTRMPVETESSKQLPMGIKAVRVTRV